MELQYPSFQEGTIQDLPPPVNLSQPAPNVFTLCNQGVANGFGAMFFNIRDPTFQQTNTPLKKDSSLHIPLIIGTILLIILIGVGIGGLNNYFKFHVTIIFVGGGYLTYLLLSLYCGDLRQYISNMKRNSQYEQTYNKMVKGRGYFTFWIECYHYVTRTRKGRTQRRKVVTHTATQRFNVTDSFDQSGQIGSIFDEKDYIFVHYLKRYYFTDDASQNKFQASFNYFVHRNRRDTHQSYTQTFEIEGYEQFTSFSVLGQGGRSRFTFYLFTFLGLGLPFAFIFQKFVSRYEVGLLKRLTV